jgi:hypothetical protein
MKTQELLKKRPKAGQPVSVKTLKGGLWYFAVGTDVNSCLFIDGPFIIHGKPFRNKQCYGYWKVCSEGENIDKHRGGFYLSDYGILPYTVFLRRTFRCTGKVWNFYKKIVKDQNLEAYKEAIKATI